MSDDADRTEQGRRLAESLRRAAEIAEGDGEHEIRVGPRVLPEQNEGFQEGAEAHRRFRENICPNGINPLGPWIAPPRRGVSLEEKAEVVYFLPHHIALFRILTPERAAALGMFVIRLTERQTVARWWRWAWKAAVGLVVTAFAVARWGVDQVPLLRDLVNLIRGHGS